MFNGTEPRSEGATTEPGKCYRYTYAGAAALPSRCIDCTERLFVLNRARNGVRVYSPLAN